MQGMHTRFWIIMALLMCSLSSASWGRAAQPEAEFNIPPQALESALLAFAEQANVQISVATLSVTGMRTRGVSGRLAPAAALAQLLAESGLRFVLVGDRTYSVAASPAAESGSTTSGTTAIELHGLGALRFAEEDPIEPSPRVPSAPASRPVERGESPAALGEVVVTGTYLRDHAPVGAQVLILDREAIEQTGLSTVTEVLRTLPQNFRGGPGDETSSGREAGNNFGFGATGVNLRGLGAGSTLVLVDGHRLAPGGTEGVFTDISAIPLAAVERIEVLTDGASAAYGSDAVGGVVNFILRRNYQGAETQLRAGSVTDGGMREYVASQAIGGKLGESTSALLSYEYYQRDPLPMSARELSADSDLTRFGGTNWSSTYSNPGNIIIDGQRYAIPRNQDGTALTPADFQAGTVNYQNLLEGRDVLPELERHGVFGTLRQGIGERGVLTLDALYSRRDTIDRDGAAGAQALLFVPSTNPFYVNPTGGTDPIEVEYNFTADLPDEVASTETEAHSLVLGLQLGLFADWSLSAFASHAGSEAEQAGGFIDSGAVDTALNDPNPATALNPFADGGATNPTTSATFRAPSSYLNDSRLRQIGAVANGTLFNLPAGKVKLAVGAEHTRSSFEATTVIEAFDYFTQSSTNRTISAAFGEVLVPIMSSGRGHALELSLASRFEDYSDFGRANTPRVGISWSSNSGWNARGSWSKSFKAPSLIDLDETNNSAFLRNRPDSQSPTGSSRVLLWFGNNADLEEERAKIWSAGFGYTSPSVEGLSFSVSYFDIDFEGRIESAPDGAYLVDPALAGLVTRNPTAAQQERVCANSSLEVSVEDCLNEPIAAIIDARMRNTAVNRVAGLDLLASQAFRVGPGTVNLALNATYLTTYDRQDTEAVALQDVLNTPANPIDLRARAELSWSIGGWRAGAFVNYQDAYRDEIADRRLASWTTTDLQISYALADAPSWLQGSRASLSVQNVLDEQPAFYDNPVGFIGYDPDNGSVLGRFVSLQLSKTW